MSGSTETRALLGQWLLPEGLPQPALLQLLLSGNSKPLAVLPFAFELE
jgi:hypothetical protein